MRITLNLATRPFVDLRSVYTRLRIFMLALIVLAAPLWYLLHIEGQKAAAANARVDALHAKINRLEDQQQKYRALMQQPQNAAILNQADYLNALFRQKAFSWTAIMMDLETVLPGGVMVQSIEPSIAQNGDVTIRMRVSGARERSIALIRNLEHSRHFAQPRIASEALQTSSTGEGAQNVSAGNDVNFDVLAEYRPLSEVESTTAAQTKAGARNGKTQKAGNPGSHGSAAPAKRQKRHPARPQAAPGGPR
jgi:type IV pilus assembly protein PilN